MKVITRFAPSPTGFLHIGSARTALFNYLFAKKHGGKFLLRIEDTDKSRNNDESLQKILDSLKWLGLDWDGEIVYQSQLATRHASIAHQLLKESKAYRCFTSQEEIAAQREASIAKKEPFIFRSKWRDADEEDLPDSDFVIRIKAPREGQTIVRDLLQGDVVIDNSHIDDMVILRSDGTPTYMLAAPVDDHDMGITYIIRGDDHLNNAARQQVIYDALGWEIPKMVHIPLIHGPDGAKLSKRHGALGAHEYEEQGYLAEALFNYLLKLGWSSGDKEFFSKKEAIDLFNLEHLGKSPSRIDFDKMRNVNAHYIKELSDDKIVEIVKNGLKDNNIDLNPRSLDNLYKAAPEIKPRASLTQDIIDIGKLYCENIEITVSQESLVVIKQIDDNIIFKITELIRDLSEASSDIDEYSSFIQGKFKDLAKHLDIKLGELMKYVRVLVTGQINSPSMFNLLAIIGKSEALRRIELAYRKY